MLKFNTKQKCLKCHGYGHGEAQCANRRYISLEELSVLKQQRNVPNRRTWKSFLLDLESYHLQVLVEEDQRAYARDYVSFHHHHNEPNASKEELFEVYLEGMELYEDDKSRFPSYRYMSVPKEPNDDHSALEVQEDVIKNSELVDTENSKFDEPMEEDSCMIERVQTESLECAQVEVLEVIPHTQQELEHPTFILANPIDVPIAHYFGIMQNRMELQDHSYLLPSATQIEKKTLLQNSLHTPIPMHQSSIPQVAHGVDYAHGVQLFGYFIRLLWQIAWIPSNLQVAVLVANIALLLCYSIRLIWQVAWFFFFKLVVKFFLKKERMNQQVVKLGRVLKQLGRAFSLVNGYHSRSCNLGEPSNNSVELGVCLLLIMAGGSTRSSTH